jgi:hypothetical protein
MAPDTKRECRSGSGLLLNQSDLRLSTLAESTHIPFISSNSRLPQAR